MRGFFQDFLSHKALFFDQLDFAANNMVEMAVLLAAIVATDLSDEREVLFKQVDKLEHAGDDITHKIRLALGRITFTPLNRNDINSLAAAIANVSDMIKEASNRINLYNITDFVAPVKDLAGLLLKASSGVRKSVSQLKLLHSSDDILTNCREVKEYERQADKVYYNAVAELFLHDKDPIHLLKYHEILYSLETAVNKCKGTADVLEVILINR